MVLIEFYQLFRYVICKKSASDYCKGCRDQMSHDGSTCNPPWRLQQENSQYTEAESLQKNRDKFINTCAAPRAIVASIERSPHSWKQTVKADCLATWTRHISTPTHILDQPKILELLKDVCTDYLTEIRYFCGCSGSSLVSYIFKSILSWW